MFDRINKTEEDLMIAAIERIMTREVTESDLGDCFPTMDDLNDSNHIISGKVSVLFVDIRDSTKLSQEFPKEQLVKIYRSYIRTVVQAIRHSDGEVRDFMGDGILAVFLDNECGKSEDKAVCAARYITTVIDKLLNPVLNKHLNYRISCGIGIHTGDVSLSKVGMKGKEQDDNSENEFGVAWIGNSTNLACKQSGAVNSGTIFICKSTYAELSDINKKNSWQKVRLLNGKNTLEGYVSKKYYLPLDEEHEACISTVMKGEENDLLSIIEKKTCEIQAKSSELSILQKELKSKDLILTKKEKQLNIREELLNRREYQLYCEIVESGHCKKDYVISMGQDFWEENLKYAIDTGAKIGKDEHKVKQDLSYAMVSIYEYLNLYDKAYDFLVEQAKGHSWLHFFTVQNIVGKVKYCSRLLSAVKNRLEEYNLSPYYQNEFEKIKKWLEEYNKQ